MSDSHVAKLLLIPFEKQKVVDPRKWFQSAVKSDKSWQWGSKISSIHTQSPCYLLAVEVNGGNVTIGHIPGM